MDYLLQMGWDASLIRGWRKFGKMHAATWHFLCERNLTSCPEGMLRWPKPWHMRMECRPWVAQALPALSERLLAGWDDAKVLGWLDDSRLEARERLGGEGWKKAVREVRAVDVPKNQRTIYVNRGHRRSDWGVCKPTNGR